MMQTHTERSDGLFARMIDVIGRLLRPQEQRPYDPYEAKQANWQIEQAAHEDRYRF